MLKRGYILVCDGNNGSGKTTALPKIAEHLRSKGHEVVCSFEPGGTKIGQQIRTLVRGTDNQEMSDITGMMLFAAARAQNVHEVIRPALERGCIVLLDRFTASKAFQIAGQGMPAELVEKLDEIARDGISADYTLIFDIDPRIGAARTQSREVCDDKFELTGFEFLDRVRADYLKQASDEPERFDVIDASQSFDRVLHDAVTAFDSFIDKHVSLG